MILVSVDPETMISIPRDFWVPYPTSYGYQKIDVASEVDGIALARSTVEKLFGIKVDYYAWVGLNGLVQVSTRPAMSTRPCSKRSSTIWTRTTSISSGPHAFFACTFPPVRNTSTAPGARVTAVTSIRTPK
jgi:hypothetical protein